MTAPIPTALTASTPVPVLELVAAAPAQVDTTRRTITGCLIPAPVNGVQAVATTSAGPTRFTGRLSWSADLSRVKLLTEHDKAHSVGYATAVEYRADGSLWATWHVPPAPATYTGTWPGDVALYEAQHHIRDGLSVGAFDLSASYAADGVLEVQAGQLREGSLCSIPAFDDSRVTDVAASHPGRHHPMYSAAQLAALAAAGIDPADKAKADAYLTSLTAGVGAPAAPAAPAPVVHTPAPTELSASQLMEQLRDLLASAQPTGAVPNLGGPNHQPGTPASAGSGTGPRELSLSAFTDMLVDHYRGAGSPIELRAALADVTVTNQQQGANGDASTMAFRPTYLNELWESTDAQRKFIDNATTTRPAPTGLELIAQRWVTKPIVDDYAGDKADIPTNVPELEDIKVKVQRVAGGHDVDRALIDLGSPEWLRTYFEGQTESYRLKSNAKAIATALAGTPALVDNDASPATFATLLQGVIAGVVDLATVGQGVEYVAMAPGLIAELLGVTNLDAPAWFSGSFQLGNKGDGGVGGTTWFTDPGLPAGQFMLGQKSAVRYHEVDPPIRVQAVNVPQGGIDLGVFGYLWTYVRDANKVRKGMVGA